MANPDEKVDNDLEKFEMVEDFFSGAWARTKRFWLILVASYMLLLLSSCLK